jgi:integrase
MQSELQRQHNCSLSRATINKILQKHSQPPLKQSRLSRKKRHRYERDVPGDRVQMDKAEIKRVSRKYSFHIFRHSAGTLLYTKSRDLKLVQGTLRHADLSVTSDIYVHLDDKVLNEGAEILTAEILTNCDLFVTQESKMVS